MKASTHSTCSRRVRASAYVVLLFAFIGAGNVVASPAVRFSGSSSFVVSGLPPRGTVSICGIGNLFVKGAETHMTQAQTLTADDSGTAQVSVQTPAFQSVWLVVDLTSGAYAVVSPPGYAPTRMPVAPTTTADLAGVGVAWPVLETFVVRPSGGIWQAVVADGRDTDADHAEGKVKLDLRSFVPMGSTNTTLTHLAEGDVLLFDDPNHFEYSVLQVQKGANGAR